MTPQQASLLRKAHDSLRGASLLVANGLNDIAASRAYYTMFYIAQAFLLGENLTFSSHAAVISAFGRELTRTGRVPVEFHRYLIDAQDKRNQADYNIDSSITESQATELISRAEEFLQLAQSMLGSLPPS